MPRKRPSVAARWSAWKRAGSRTLGASPLSPITFPATLLRGLVEIAPGADLTADPATWSWVDITQWVRHDLGISTVVGRRDQAGTVDPSRATLKLDNRDGRFSRRNPVGPYYEQLTRNTPIRLAVDPGDGMHYRYHGHVNEWPKRWDKSGNDSTITIQCGGTLRRLQRSTPLRSAQYRSIISTSPVAYYPFEDESGSTSAASGLPGGQPARVSGGTVQFGGASMVPAGSANAADLSEGGRLEAPTGLVSAAVDSWEMEGVFGWDTLPANSGKANLIVGMTTPGSTVFEWGIGTFESAGTLRFGIYRRTTAGISLGFSSQTISAGQLYHFRIKMTQNGADIDYERWLNGVLVGSGSESGATLRAPVQARFNAGFSTSQMPHSISHVAVWTPVRTTFDTYEAVDGYAGELAHERVIRICAEEGINLRCVAGVSSPLGAQPSGTVLDILRDAERTDGGVLYEHEFGLGFKAISEYYNQPVGLALDFDSGHVADPPEADDSDLRFRNEWTASRRGGSEATIRDPDYDVSQGLSSGSTTVNPETDDRTADIARWLVHRDTTDEDYWTGLKLRFSRTPDLIPAWTALPFGSRFTVANPPTQADPGDIDGVVEGWSERWDQVQWEATLNTSPASVYRVGVWEDTGSRYSSRYTVLAEDLDTTETSIDVTVNTGRRGWITTATHPARFPFDIGFGGEQMTVTAIVDNGSGSYTFTVTRSVNGIVKSHAAGKQVRLWRPARYAL